jgi:hypothetical protein
VCVWLSGLVRGAKSWEYQGCLAPLFFPDHKRHTKYCNYRAYSVRIRANWNPLGFLQGTLARSDPAPWLGGANRGSGRRSQQAPRRNHGLPAVPGGRAMGCSGKGRWMRLGLAVPRTSRAWPLRSSSCSGGLSWDLQRAVGHCLAGIKEAAGNVYRYFDIMSRFPRQASLVFFGQVLFEGV